MRLTKLLSISSILLSATALTACGDEKPQTVSDIVVRDRYMFAEPDVRLRTCAARPAKRAVKTDKALATLATEAMGYGDDCSSKLDSTWKSIDDAKARAAALNNPPVENK